jgi:hypothetical protein
MLSTNPKKSQENLALIKPALCKPNIMLKHYVIMLSTNPALINLKRIYITHYTILKIPTNPKNN